MAKSVAIVGAGVSGLTTAIVFAEHGCDASIFAEKTGQQTTSGAAAAIWFPYDAGPISKVIPWALESYKVLVELSRDSRTGVSMIELRQFSRAGKIQIPDWAQPFVIPSAHPVMSSGVEGSLTLIPSAFASGYSILVPLMDTTIYLDYLRNRLTNAGGAIHCGVSFEKLEDVGSKFDLVINCAGIGARELVHDVDLAPHRGQVAIVPKIDALERAVVCDDTPFMYAIPRANDCVFGGTNEISDDLNVDPAATARIVSECSRVLNIEKRRVLAELVGLRPFRKSGVRVEAGKLRDGRSVIHNYAHGGAGFTLSWGCAENVFEVAAQSARSTG